MNNNICLDCGSEMTASGTFCAHCGTIVSSRNSRNSEKIDSVGDESIPTPVTVYSNQYTSSNTSIFSEYKILIIISIIVVFFIGIIVYFSLGEKGCYDKNTHVWSWGNRGLDQSTSGDTNNVTWNWNGFMCIPTGH